MSHNEQHCMAGTFKFGSLRELFAKANEEKSGDQLAGIAARSEQERVAAKRTLADLTLREIVANPLIPPEEDDVSRLILETHDQQGFKAISGLTVGELRELILRDETSEADMKRLHWAITPEIAAAVAKLMSNKDLVLAGAKVRVVTRCRNTMGERGVLGIRLQPNHPADDVAGILLAAFDGLLYGCGDAVIGVNPATDSVETVSAILHALDRLIDAYKIPTQACCLAHISTQLAALDRGAPVDLLFQSVAGTQKANESFGITLDMLREGRERVLEDHFMGKLLGLPMGCDVCYTNHAAADQNSADNLLMLLTAAGCNYFMGVPCADDVMLNYQSTSYHDAIGVRRLFNQRPAPEFLMWLGEA